MTKYVVYTRVSRKTQFASGLGLEAQQRMVDDYLAKNGGELLMSYVEVESGRKSARPEFRKALFQCRLTGATLLIAKLDRLARSVAVTATLMESGVPFICCDMPSANNFTIHILAAVAEDEAKAISSRTKAALFSAKLRGTKLGAMGLTNLTKNPEAVSRGREQGAQAVVDKANKFAAKIKPVIQHHIDNGLTLAQTAEKLNEAHILSARGLRGKWTTRSIKNVLSR